MVSYARYIEKDNSTVLTQIIKDIQETSQIGRPKNKKLIEQERVIKAIHTTLKCFYEDSLRIFVGSRYIHWFAFNNSSVHFKRDELLHLSDAEISEFMVYVLSNKQFWFECDIEELEETMPHKSAKAMCISCGNIWNMNYSILGEERKCYCSKCGEKEQVIVSY